MEIKKGRNEYSLESIVYVKRGMRGKKAVINTVVCLLQEIVAVACGFILPRLILLEFGSKYNGVISSITQFLACAVLLRSGIGGVTRAALYKPFAEKNQNDINAIVKATDNFMKRVGLILAGLIFIFAVIYPFLVNNEFGWFFTFSLFLIIGASTFAESFFGITYLIVLQADQRIWVDALMRTVCCILNTIISIFLILNDFSIHIVKLGSALIYVLYPIVLGVYVRKHYKIDGTAEPNNKAISQRWDAFWQQVAIFVMNNTDVMLLTIFTNVFEVSVYTIYNMVVNALKQGIYAFSNGLEGAFGDMIAKNEEKSLRENIAIIENLIYAVSTIVYTCAALLILDFVNIYTRDVSDVQYIRPIFAYVIILAQFFNSIRRPYQLVVQAAGHYKQTKKGAIIEPIINISVSIVFVIKFGLVGVAVGTLVATLYRTIQYAMYMSKNIVKRNWWIMIYRCVISVVESGIIIFIAYCINMQYPTDYLMLVQNAVIIVSISCIIVFIGNCVFFPSDFKKAIRMMKSILIKKD